MFIDFQFRYKKKYYKNLPSNLKKLKNVNDLVNILLFIFIFISIISIIPI